MPDADPKADWTVRGVPRSVRLWYRGQAAARGLSLAQWLTLLKEMMAEYMETE